VHAVYMLFGHGWPGDQMTQWVTKWPGRSRIVQLAYTIFNCCATCQSAQFAKCRGNFSITGRCKTWGAGCGEVRSTKVRGFSVQDKSPGWHVSAGCSLMMLR